MPSMLVCTGTSLPTVTRHSINSQRCVRVTRIPNRATTRLGCTKPFLNRRKVRAVVRAEPPTALLEEAAGAGPAVGPVPALVCLGLCVAVVGGTVGTVLGRASESIEDRNQQIRLTRRLRELELRLLNEPLDPDARRALKLEVVKLKLAVKALEENAAQGEGIQGAVREQTEELTAASYVRKAFGSTLKKGRQAEAEREARGEAKWVSQLSAAVTAVLIILLCIQFRFLLQID